MRQNFFLQLKSLLVLFVLSLCCTTAWAIDNCVIKYKATEDLSSAFKSAFGESNTTCGTWTDANTPVTVTVTGTTTIPYGTLQGNTALTSVCLESGWKEVGAYAFKNCSNVTTITLNDGLNTIGYNSFGSSYKRNLTSVICKGQTPPTQGLYNFSAATFLIHVPAGKAAEYREAWKGGESVTVTVNGTNYSGILTDFSQNVVDPDLIRCRLNLDAPTLDGNTLTFGISAEITANGTSNPLNGNGANISITNIPMMSTLATDDTKKTVTFYNATLDDICTGTLSACSEAGKYLVTVSGADNIAKIKAYQGQQIKIKIQKGALLAVQTPGDTPSYDLPGEIFDYTVPADVTFDFSNTNYNRVDDSQLMTGFNLIVTAGTEAPTLDNDKRFLLSYGSETYVVVLDPTPTLVPGTTNQWKYTAKVKTDPSGYVRIYSYGDEYGDYIHKAVPMVAGDHSFTLTVPAGAFTSGWSTNTAAVGVAGYDLYPKAAFTFTTDGVIKDGSNYTFIVNLKATAPTAATDDDKNPYLNYVDYQTYSQDWTVSDYTGTVGVELDEFTSSSKSFKITLDYSKLDLTKSSYVLTIPAGKFKANFNENEMTYLSFTIVELPQWTKAPTSQTDGYKVSIDEADGVATIVPTKNNLPLTILDASKIDLYYGGGSGVSANFMDVPGSSELKVVADFKKENAPYYVQFCSGAVKAGNTVFTSDNSVVVARIDVTANFTFVDASVEGETATTKDDVKAKTYNQLTYKRNYTGNTETLYVPFDIKPTEENQILDNVYIWKLVNITEENGNPVFNFTQVENGQTVYANEPCLIRKKDGVADAYDMVLNNVTTKAPVSSSIESSTVTDTYTFTGVVEASSLTGETGKLWIVKSSTGYLINVPTGDNATLDPWRWYMTTTSNNIQYAKLNLDGIEDEDATGIGRIENGELIIDNSAIYNLNGQRMSKPQRGSINIINGKKVFVK